MQTRDEAIVESRTRSYFTAARFYSNRELWIDRREAHHFRDIEDAQDLVRNLNFPIKMGYFAVRVTESEAVERM